MGVVRASTQRHGPLRITTGRQFGQRLSVTAHCYLLGDTLLDAGPPNRVRDVLALLEGHRVDRVLLTHRHEDHVGAAARLAAGGAEVLAPPRARERLAARPPLPRYRRIAWGQPEPVVAGSLPTVVEAGQHTFEVIEVPGHSPDHVAFLERDTGWLFAGDAYLGRRRVLRADEDLQQVLASFDRLAALDAVRLFPGHGPVEQHPRQAIEATHAWFLDLQQRASRLARRGHSAGRIARELLGPLRPEDVWSGGDVSRTNLVDQLLELAS